MALITTQKLKREAVPLLFFGTVVSVKVYFLLQLLIVDGGIDKVRFVLEQADLSRDDVRLLLTGLASSIAYNVVAILFDALVFVSYLMRMEAKDRARGFSETVFPLATVLLPVTGFTLLAIPDVRAMIPDLDLQQIALDYSLPAMFPLLFDITGLTIGLLGAALSIVALWTLKRSFSLMAEVRELVTSGLYRWVRHPLYMAEIIHILGMALLSKSPAGLWLFAVALVMQVIRAKIEERKLSSVVPEYAQFKASTGFLWPKLF